MERCLAALRILPGREIELRRRFGSPLAPFAPPSPRPG
jgi:hypothetical protein